MRRFRFLLEAAMFGLLLAAARVTPRRLLLGAGSLAGGLAPLLDRRHYRIALENLRLALGRERELNEVHRIARACWRHFGRIIMDSLAFPRLGPESVGSVVHYEGLEHIREAYARGKGVLVFSGHYGHWEVAAVMQGFLGLPLVLVARPLDNRRLERMLARLRGRSGNRVVHKRNAVREMLRALRSGLGVAIAIDQDARADGVFVPFFGRLASTTPTLALMALRSGAPVIPVSCVPEGRGEYRVVYEPEVAVERTGSHEQDVLRLTARCTEIVEGWVRRRPELWLWMHQRWKSAPPAENRSRSNIASTGDRAGNRPESLR